MSSKANRINIQNLRYAMLVEDTKENIEYEEIKDFGKIMEIQLTPTLATGQLHGEGQIEEDISKITGIEVQVSINKIPIEVRAEILGNTYKDGMLFEGPDDQPKYFALCFTVEQTRGHKEIVWLFKGSAQPYGNTVKQAESNINFSTDSLKITFMTREYDNKIRFFADTAAGSFTEEQINKLLNEIPSCAKVAEGEVIA